MRKLLASTLALTLSLSMALPVAAASNNGTNPTSISVTGTYQPASGGNEVISADISWDDMSFTYDAGDKGSWNQATHTYENPVAPSWKNEQKTITIKNHSNTKITASFAFTSTIDGMNGTFTETSVTLDSADADAYRTNIEGTNTLNAPESSTKFSIASTSPAISKETTIGTISVTIQKTVPSNAE